MATLTASAIAGFSGGGESTLMRHALEHPDLDERRDFLTALMTSPGPFYQYADGRFFRDDIEPDAAAYLGALDGIPVHEAVGRVDFPNLTRQLEVMHR